MALRPGDTICASFCVTLLASSEEVADYVDAMSDWPSSNEATEWMRRAFGSMRSITSAPSQWPVTDDFVYEDRSRRGGVNFGRLNAPAWMRMMDTFWEPGGGQPDFEIVEPIAIRGKRSAAFHMRGLYGEDQTLDVIQCVRLDPGIRRLERLIEFDVADRDAAIGELDRLQAQIVKDA